MTAVIKQENSSCTHTSFPLNCFHVYLLMYSIFRACFKWNKILVSGRVMDCGRVEIDCHLKAPLLLETFGKAPATFLMCDSVKSHTYCTLLWKCSRTLKSLHGKEWNLIWRRLVHAKGKLKYCLQKKEKEKAICKIESDKVMTVWENVLDPQQWRLNGESVYSNSTLAGISSLWANT